MHVYKKKLIFVIRKLKKMLVTINTDASFHPSLKYGAYAFWAICNNFKIIKSGVFRTKCINSHDAEAKCIINALKVVLLTHKGITKIIVNTDSLNAIALITDNREHVKKYIGNNQVMWKHIRKAYHETMKHKTNIKLITM